MNEETDTLNDIARALKAASGLLEKLPSGKLTDDEKVIIGAADAVVGAVEAVAELTKTTLDDALMRVIANIPVAGLARLAVAWRKIEARADEISISVGGLGPDVEFEAV